MAKFRQDSSVRPLELISSKLNLQKDKKKKKYPAGYRIRINAFVVLDLLLAVDGELNVARM